MNGTVKVNADTLEAMYRRVIRIKEANTHDFTARWLCDGILYGSSSQRMTHAAESMLVNMGEPSLVDLIETAINHERTMGNMARFVNEQAAMQTLDSRR